MTLQEELYQKTIDARRGKVSEEIQTICRMLHRQADKGMFKFSTKLDGYETEEVQTIVDFIKEKGLKYALESTPVDSQHKLTIKWNRPPKKS
jgi:histidinol dehydrogenase